MTGKPSRRLGGLVLGMIGIVAAAGCTSIQSSEAQSPSSTTPTSVTATGTPVTVTETKVVNQNGNQQTPPKTSTKTSPPTSWTTTTTTSANPGAKIVSFTVTQKPVCPIYGTPDAPFSRDAKPVVISWKVTGADGAAIAVDNPGIYGAYGSDYAASGSLELSFPCSGKTGQTTHKYTVWPKGYKSISQTISVSASNT